MNEPMISEAEVEKALDYLRDTAEKAAASRANRIVVEEYRKVVKSEQMKLHDQLAIGAQEREAYASEPYKAHLKAIREAIQEDEYFRFMREAAAAKIEAWRTQSSNLRAITL